eukprot:3282678-Prymnesium_polylepis.1
MQIGGPRGARARYAFCRLLGEGDVLLDREAAAARRHHQQGAAAGAATGAEAGVAGHERAADASS